jgi:hypothetical protein
MKKTNFTKSLLLHIRYPWTAICLLILWIGLAVMCAILHLGASEVIELVYCAGVATLIIAFVGFRA